MSDIRVPFEAWVVVCDGAKALILKNAGDTRLLNLQVHETLAQPNEAYRDVGAGKPGRGHQPAGAGGSAVEETAWHEQAAEEFLRRIAAKLHELALDRDAKRIILIAPPRALGSLRPHLSAAAQAAISAEIPKDFINLPVGEIERHLAV
jgi:protein required for attachment to host cells